jgi:hypothetical protein
MSMEKMLFPNPVVFMGDGLLPILSVLLREKRGLGDGNINLKYA